MKIGIEVQRLFRKQKYGIETSSLELLRKLQAMDKKNEFVVFAKDDVDRECFSETRNFKIKTVAGKLFADFEQLYLPFAAKDERVDLLHCTGNTTPYFCPVPIVQTLHDIIFMDPIPRKDSLYQRTGNLYRRKVVPVVTPRSKTVITVSQYEKERILSRLRVEEKNIEVIYNGINEERFKITTDPLQLSRVRERYQLPKNFILFLGNQTGRKNPQGVIEAFLLYLAKSNNPLPLVTPGLSQKYITNILHQLNAHYDPAKFITPGYISDEDLPTLYSLSEVFVFPSLSEGFGMPIIEAMACGTAVITSKISCMPEISGDAALLVDPLSPPSIADALLTILDSPEMRIEKIQDGLLNSKRFSWSNTAEQVLRVYERIVHPPSVNNSSVRKKLKFEPSLYLFNRTR
jgi:glycosyltransferase involved in cell wall biosynthesis